MELDFLSPEQLEMTLKLSDILSMEDLTVAAAVLASYNWNIEVHLLYMQTALSEMQLGPLPPPVYNPYAEQNHQNPYQ